MKTKLETLIEEARLQAADHPSKDARCFADSVLECLAQPRTWVDLTPQDYAEIFRTARSVDYAARLAATKLKEKNSA